MYELVIRDEKLVENIINNDSDMMFAGVLAGHNPGRVWADSISEPTSAIVWADGLQCFQFMGNATNQIVINEWKIFYRNTIIPFLKEKDVNYFEFACEEEAWYTTINSTLKENEVNESWQRVYKSKINSKIIADDWIPLSYRFYQIDKVFISNINTRVSNQKFLIDYVEEFWGSIENYLNLGYGYVAVDK